MKEPPGTIYLIPGEWDGNLGWMWSDDPAPSYDCDPDDAIKYVRADLMGGGGGCVSPADLAARFHEVYERLAPEFGYKTRTDTRSFNPATPNGRLMIAVCSELLPAFSSPQPPAVPDEARQVLADIKNLLWAPDWRTAPNRAVMDSRVLMLERCLSLTPPQNQEK